MKKSDMLLVLAIVGVFALALCAPKANAFELCWQNPSENVDATPLTDLTQINIQIGLTQGGPYDHALRVFPDTEAGASKCAEIQVSPGTYYLVGTALTPSSESGLSNEVVKTEPDLTPKAPVIIASDRTVFTVIKQPDRFVLLPIGTVPAGTACDPNNTVNGHGAVPNDLVIWNAGATARPIVVVALCDG